MIRKALRLFTAPTPMIGRRIRNIGISLIGGGTAGMAASTQLPEVPDSWLELLRLAVEVISAVSILIGTIMTGAGQAQVKGDPDRI